MLILRRTFASGLLYDIYTKIYDTISPVFLRKLYITSPAKRGALLLRNHGQPPAVLSKHKDGTVSKLCWLSGLWVMPATRHFPNQGR